MSVYQVPDDVSAPLTDQEKKIVQRLFSAWQELPQDYKRSMTNYLMNEDDLVLNTNQIFGLDRKLKAGVQSGLAFPVAPVDQQEFILVDSLTAPTYTWQFRYNAASLSTYKWEFIGGSDAVVTVATDESTTSITFVALTTAGPSFTLPNQGDYEIGVQCQFYASGGVVGAMGYDLGGTAATVGKAATGNGAGAVIAEAQAVSAWFREAAVPASTAVVAKYRAHDNGAFTNHFLNRVLRVRPVRLA